jgi:hypothetical protein
MGSGYASRFGDAASTRDDYIYSESRAVETRGNPIGVSFLEVFHRAA